MKSTLDESSESKKAHAYTPGLKIKHSTLVQKERKLPIKGEILVSVGDKVSYDSVVAKTFVSGDPYIIRAALELGIRTEELKRYMTKKVGETVEKGDPIAEYSSFFGMINRNVLSPINGSIDTISEVTGQVIVRTPPQPIELTSYIPGKIVEVIQGEGVIIETRASFIQGIFGIGGETHGKIRMLVDSPDQKVTPDDIPETLTDDILVGGSLLTYEALEKAVNVGAKAVVVGSIDYMDLRKFMGREIGVAITGEEELNLTLILTEGFGRLQMSEKTFELFKSFQGYLACVNGATQIRAGVIRPEVIIPHEDETGLTSGEKLDAGMVPGTHVRIIKHPYFGAIGKVAKLPVDLKVIESRSTVRIVEVELDDNKIVVVPRANVEIIEE
jgi:hypothetical protein